MTGFQPEVLRDIIASNTTIVENSRSYLFTCPRCNKSKKLYIRKSDGIFRCWRCAEVDGFKGKAEWALYELFGIHPSVTRPLLYGETAEAPEGMVLHIDLLDWYGDEDEEPVYCTLPAIEWPLNTYGPNDKRFAKAQGYLDSRGITKEVAVKYDIHWSPKEQRVLIPVVVDGLLRGWQGRYIHPSVWYTDDGEKKEVPKILSTDGLFGGGTFMFQDNLIGSDHIVLCEGPFDALKADLCGGNVASMGKGVNDRQLAFLRESGASKLYLALDPDAADDISRVARSMDEMELFLMTPPSAGKDFGDCTPEEVLESYKRAERISPTRLFFHLDLSGTGITDISCN